MICVSTDSVDGVLGLNGKNYLLDENGDLMKFASEKEAKGFLGDINLEFINFEEILV